MDRVNGRPVYLYDTNEPYVLVRGPMREWLKTNGVPAPRTAAERGGWVRGQWVPDLTARLEVARFVVRPRGVRR